MFGFVIGTLSLIGFIKVWRGGRWGHHGHGRFGHGGGPRRWMLRRVFQHLDATPAQEKVIATAVDNAQRVMFQSRDQFFRARGDFAKAMRGEHFDGAAFDTHASQVDELKKVIKEGLQEIHEVLSPQQREKLADLIEFGPARMHGGYGYGYGPGCGPRVGRGDGFRPTGDASVNV